MESPSSYLERRNAEIDRDLAACLRRLGRRDDAAAFVRDHPVAALGSGAAAGFLAARLAIGGRGLRVVRRLLGSTARLAFLGALRRRDVPPNTAASAAATASAQSGPAPA